MVAIVPKYGLMVTFIPTFALMATIRFYGSPCDGHPIGRRIHTMEEPSTYDMVSAA